jgi:iron complex outermembrane receptor protein
MQKISSIFGLLLLLSINIYGESDCNYKITGVIIDSISRKPIEASFTLEKLKTTVIANNNGEFAIEHLCQGEYTAIVQTLGYRLKKIQINVPSNSIIIELTSTLVSIHEFVFEEHKREEMEALNKEELAGNELFLQQGNNLSDALKKIAGINTLNTGSNISKPMIHGLHSNRVLILNNGIRHEGQNWGSEHAPEIDPYLAKNISVVKGANAVRYGSDAIAGVIIIEPNNILDIKKLNTEINFHMNTNGRGGSTNGIIEYCHPRFNNIKARIQGTTKQLGSVETPNYLMNNTAVKEVNYSGAVGWVKEKVGFEYFYSRYNSQIGIFKGAHIGNLSDLDSIFTRATPRDEYINEFSYNISRPKQEIEHVLQKIKVYNEWKGIGKINLVMALQRNCRSEYDAHKPRGLNGQITKPELQFLLNTQTLDIIWEHLVKRGFSGSVGITGLTQDNSYQGRNLIPNFITRSVGFFGIEHYKKNKIEIEFGVRYDYRMMHVIKRNINNSLVQPSFSYQIPSSTLGVIYVRKKATIKGYMGTAFRAPAINELFINGVHHGNGTFEIGNQNLRAEKAMNASVNLSYFPIKSILIQIEIYNNYIYDFIYLQPTKPAVLTVLGAFPTFTYQQCNARLTGADLKVLFTLHKKFNIEVKSSILYARNISQNRWLELMPSNKHEIIATYKSKITNIEASYVYQSMQKRVTAGIDYAHPPGSYSLINLLLNKEIESKKIKLLLAIGVNNILNTQYRDYLNSYRYYSDDIGRNINFKIKINF